MDLKWNKIGLFAGGVAFGTAGIKALSSKDAKKAYTHTVAAALRVKECIMAAATKVKENSDDILADAKEINEKRAEKEAVVEDTAKEETAAETTAETAAEENLKEVENA
jgi:hypothetical protein